MKTNQWIDVGCPNFDEAARNRKRIAEGQATQWWKQMEHIRDTTSLSRLFTRTIDGEPLPLGDLVYYNRHEKPRRKSSPE